MKRAIRNLLFVVATALIVFGGLELVLQYAQRQKAGLSWAHLLLGLVLVVAGIGLFAAGNTLAEKISDHFEP